MSDDETDPEVEALVDRFMGLWRSGPPNTLSDWCRRAIQAGIELGERRGITMENHEECCKERARQAELAENEACAQMLNAAADDLQRRRAQLHERGRFDTQEMARAIQELRASAAAIRARRTP